jgi:hypothetical protein
MRFVESISVKNCACVGWSLFSKKLLRRLRLSFALSQWAAPGAVFHVQAGVISRETE